MKKANQYAVRVYSAFTAELCKQEQAVNQQCGDFKIAVKRTRKAVKARNSKLVNYWLKAGGALATFSAQQEQQK